MNTIQTISLMALIGLLNIGIWSNYDAPGVVAPQLREQWKFTTAQLGQAYSLYSFPNLIVPIAYGALVDRLGPLYGLPLFLMISQLFVAGSSLAIWLCGGNIPVFLGARTAMGFGGEFIMLCQYAAAAKWFPLNQQGVADALIMIIGMVALACLFNIFPLIVTKTSISFAFGISTASALIALLLSIVYVVFHIVCTKRNIAEAAAKVAPGDVELGSSSRVPSDEATARSVSEGPDVEPATVNDDEIERVQLVQPQQIRTASVANADSDDWSNPGSTIASPNHSVRPSIDASRQSIDTRFSMDSRFSIEGSRQSIDPLARKLITAPSPSLLAQKMKKAKTGVTAPFVAMFANLRRFPTMFWMLLLCCGFNIGVVQTFLVFSTDLLATKWGLGKETAARLSSIVVSSPIVASLPIGYLIDKFGHRISGFITSSCLMIASFVLLAFLPGTTHMAVPAACLVLLGLVFSFIPTVEGAAFSLTCPSGLLSTGMGMSYVLNMLTTTCFPLVIGYLFEWKQSYMPGLLLLASSGVISLVVALVALFVDRNAPKHGMECLQLPCGNVHAAH